MEEKKIKILFVEDLPHDAEMAQRVIRKENIEFTNQVVDNEEEFRKALSGFNPDIIISDYSMPAFDGMTALKITREQNKYIPFVVLTGSMNEETAVACMKAGANDYVIKEHINRLPFAVKEAIENSKARKERDLIEKSLRESEEKFRHLFQDHVAIKLILDPENGDIIEANNAACKFYGYSKKKLESMNIDQINTLSREEIKVLIEKVRRMQQNNFELSHRLADGSIRFVETFSSKVKIKGKEYLHSVIHDVTEKKTAQNQLRLLSKSVEQSRVSIIIADKEGNIEYVNPFFTKLTGYSFEEAKNNKPSILKSGQQSEEFYREMWNTLLSGKDWTGELLNKKKDGTLYWESAIISPIEDDDGKITHFVGVKEDITERKKMIRDLVDAKEKAEESDKLKSAFLANVSHEIRTPMNGILGFIDLLQDPDTDPGERKMYVNILNESTNRLMDTINDLVEISRIEAGQVSVKESRVVLKDVMEYLHEFFRPEMEKKGLSFSVVNNCPEEPADFFSDRYKIEAILSNLLKNAVKFTDEGYVELGCRLSEDKKNVVFTVKDTGRGIDEDKKQIIFDRFVQSELELTRTYEGAGLGLSISKAYSELLGGEITVESVIDKGSTFSLSVPLEKNDPETENELPGSNHDLYTSEKKKILIAEDDLSSTEYLKKILSEENYNVIIAADGEEAVSLYKKNPGIDIILMDIKMPVMNGYDATKKIRETDSHIPIIAQTAYAFQGDKAKALEAGCDDYISKPIRKKDLLKMIEKYV